MRTKLVAGNWKMNGTSASIRELLLELTSLLPEQSKAVCAVFPPVAYFSLASELLSKSHIQWGAQNVYPANAGAFTGEISGPMLNDFNCSYVLVGHSERRSLFAEHEKFIAKKFHHAKDHDMIPVLCVGETLEERERGLTEQVLARQLLAVSECGKEDVFNNSIIAYEPVWAIGTGCTASPDQVQEVHNKLRALMAEYGQRDADSVSIIYGGSVNEKNAKALFSMPDVDGGLIGGASLNARQFAEIVQCIN